MFRSYIMPTRSKTTKKKPRKKRARRQQGDGKALDWIKDTAKKAYRFVKDKQLISKGLAAVAPLAGPFAPHVIAGSAVANALGYGRKRSRTTKRRKRPRRS